VRASKLLFAGDKVGDCLKIAGVIAAEGAYLSGNSRKPKDLQYTETAFITAYDVVDRIIGH
jgi:hypothetical protein